MAFTAGSPELARAEKLGLVLSALASTYGITAMRGLTGAHIIEDQARKYGFGITGLTTGAGFPPFGTSGITQNSLNSVHGVLTSVLQNPTGLTRPNGITVSVFGDGQTVGLYMRKFVRDGSDTTITTSAGVAGNTLGFNTGTLVNGGFTASLYFAVATGATGVWKAS
jgi:hypothetical protein